MKRIARIILGLLLVLSLSTLVARFVGGNKGHNTVQSLSTSSSSSSTGRSLREHPALVMSALSSLPSQAEPQDSPTDDPTEVTAGDQQRSAKALPLLGLVGLSSLVASFLTRPRT